MTILVTGGAGFIGSNFVRDWLAATTENIVILDKLTYAGNLKSLEDTFSSPRLKFIEGDILDSALVSRLLQDHSPRAIVNFAAESHVDRSIHSPEDFIQTNIVGTFRLLQTAREWWISLSENEKSKFRFLHISTDEVYGSLSESAPAFSETHRYEPNSPYSASKASADHLVRSYYHTYKFPVLTTNCSNNYGPYQFPEKLIPLVILNALSGKNLPIYGDGKNIRDWLYVTDHCRALRLVLEKGRCGETYNIGGNAEKTNIEIVHAICDILDRDHPKKDGSSYKSQIAFITDRPGHDRRYAIDSRKIAAELGWRPEESLATGLEKTVRWYTENPEWVRSVVSGEYRAWQKLHYGQT
jgi:dTDP-glucose 4,6-dehydratase